VHIAIICHVSLAHLFELVTHNVLPVQEIQPPIVGDRQNRQPGVLLRASYQISTLLHRENIVLAVVRLVNVITRLVVQSDAGVLAEY